MDEVAPGANTKPDLSKTTLVVLVLLTLVISVIGTWSVLNEVNSIRVVSKPSTSQGKVSLTVVDASAQQPKIDSGTGHVILNIEPSGGQ